MIKMPPGKIKLRRGQKRYPLRLTPEIHALLQLYAQDTDTSMTDAGNRMILGFLAQHYGFESSAELARKAFKAIFPDQRAIYDALVSVIERKRPYRRPLPLRRDGKLPFSSADSGSSDQNNP